jgi:hypothetical protein
LAKIRAIRVKIFVAKRRGKLASNEVAGGGGQNEFVPRETMESGGCFPASFQGARFCGRGFQPQCGWLISDAPSEQSAEIKSWLTNFQKLISLSTQDENR